MASTNAVDRYFMLVRRRLSTFERPIATASRSYRRWHGYQGYNPAVGMKLLETFRVAYNFHLSGRSGTTPAQRLGLIDHPMALEDILSFEPPITPPRRRRTS